MKNLILFIALSLLSVANLFAQKSNITAEYFMKPLIEEIKAEFPYKKPKITDGLISKSLVRAVNDCKNCFEVLDGTSVTEARVNSQKSKSKNNPYQINFADYISVDGYYQKSYIYNFIRSRSYGDEFDPSIKDFKSFKKYESSRLKEAGFKKKAAKEIIYNKLIEKRKQLGTLLAEFYAEYDYKVNLYNSIKKRYSELYKGTKYNMVKEQSELLKEKISLNFNSLDNILIHPSLTSKVNTAEENEMLKEKLIKDGLVKIIKDGKQRSDGWTYIFPKPNEKYFKDRVETLKKYFPVLDRVKGSRGDWRFAKGRILELWYGNLETAFALENFLEVCGTNVPSKEEFLQDEKKLKKLTEEYRNVLYNIAGMYKASFEPLFDNIVSNHYGIQKDDLKDIRKQQSDLAKKELSEKGGLLKGKRYFKINKQGKFDVYYFTPSLSFYRDINQSEYSGSYEKTSNNIYKIAMQDEKTGIQLPEFEARLSSDRKKLYLGEDKIPYKLENLDEPNHLLAKEEIRLWKASDGIESFSTEDGGTWESSITGGIQAYGSLYKISSNMYAYVIYDTSWGAKLNNNLVIITTSDNWNSIYYGKGRKKMILVK